MRIDAAKYPDILREFKKCNTLSDLELTKYDSTIDCYRFIVPSLSESGEITHIVCVESIHNSVIAVYEKNEFQNLWKEALIYAQKEYLGTGIEQSTSEVEISGLIARIRNHFINLPPKVCLIYLKTATVLIKIFGVWTHPIFENNTDYVDWFRENIQKVLMKIRLQDVFRERENGALKQILLNQLEGVVSNPNLIKVKAEISKINLAWSKIGYIGKEREYIERRYSELVAEFNRLYQEVAKTQGSEVYNYEQSKMPKWKVIEVKPTPFDFSGDDLSTDPRFW